MDTFPRLDREKWRDGMLTYCGQDDEVNSTSTVRGLSCSPCAKRCHSSLPGRDDKHRLLPFSDDFRIGLLGPAAVAFSRALKARVRKLVLDATEMRQATKVRHSNVGSNQENQSPRGAVFLCRLDRIDIITLYPRSVCAEAEERARVLKWCYGVTEVIKLGAILRQIHDFHSLR
jgi:hypothetical protein